MMWFLLILFIFSFIIVFQYVKANVLLPKSTLNLIDEVIANPNKDVVFNKMQYVKLDDLQVCYERIPSKNSNTEVILLLHGLGQTMLNFPPYFCKALIDTGFEIIRIDHLDSGGSSWVKNWGKPYKYTLEDMAAHALQVMDHLNINRFHVVGMSMGGMIAQRMAINYPDRISSLTSIMSSAYFHDPEFGSVPKPFLLKVVLVILIYGSRSKTLKDKIKARLAVERLLHGHKSYFFDDRVSIEQAHYELVYKKGYNPKASKHHAYAIKKSGSRLEELKKLNLPSLVIHGKADPLVILKKGEKCAANIPNCKTLFINEMGHHLPEVFKKQMVSEIADLVNIAAATDSEVLVKPVLQ